MQWLHCVLRTNSKLDSMAGRPFASWPLSISPSSSPTTVLLYLHPSNMNHSALICASFFISSLGWTSPHPSKPRSKVDRLKVDSSVKSSLIFLDRMNQSPLVCSFLDYLLLPYHSLRCHLLIYCLCKWCTHTYSMCLAHCGCSVICLSEEQRNGCMTTVTLSLLTSLSFPAN